MLEHLAGTADRLVRGRGRRPLDTDADSWLQTVLREDAASDGARVGVSLRRECGAVEVRIFGPAAALTLSFDHAEAQPAAVRCAVRAAIARYRSALGHPSPDAGGE
jgi:hypothetical protein